MTKPAAIITGQLTTGLRFTGPFRSHVGALTYAENHMDFSGFNIAELRAPQLPVSSDPLQQAENNMAYTDPIELAMSTSYFVKGLFSQPTFAFYHCWMRFVEKEGGVEDGAIAEALRIIYLAEKFYQDNEDTVDSTGISWLYEVCEPLGEWLATRLIESPTLPSDIEVRGKIFDLCKIPEEQKG